MIETLALALVVSAGLYLLVLGAASILVPAHASRFLLGFAGSPLKHFAEILLRISVGAALVVHAPRMTFQAIFSLFGWVLIVTSACLLLVPWQWHHRFAQHTVPLATRHIGLIGVSSLILGGLFVAALLRGSAA